MILLDNSNNKPHNTRKILDKNKESDPSIQGSSKEQKLKKEKRSDKTHKIEGNDLNVPEIPEPPKKKVKLTQNSPGLSAQILKDAKNLENEINKVVLVNCERCKEVIPVPIPREFIIASNIPVVPVSFVHKNPKGKDLHCITLFLDSDFDIRRQRISDVVISENI